MSNPTKFSWTPPTANEDTSPLAAGEVTGYVIGVRNTAAPGSAAGTYPFQLAVSGADTSSALISAFSPPLAAGTYAAAVQAVGPNDSPWSTPEQTFTLVEIPNAPTNFSIA